MFGVVTNLRVSACSALVLFGCGGGIDAVEDGGEAGGGGAGSGASTTATSPTAGPSGPGTGTTSGAGGPAGPGSGGDSTGAGGDPTGSGGGPPAVDCAPDASGAEVVACGFAPDLAVIGADGDAAYVVTTTGGGTSRTYRVDLDSGAKTELHHDTFSGADALGRARNHLLLDGRVYAVLNRVVGGGVDTGIFRLGDGEPEAIVPFGVTQYTHLVGAEGEIFYEGGQGLDGLFSTRVEDGATTTWLEHDGCDSCVLSGGLVGASYDGEPHVIAVYVAGGELFRIPNTFAGYGAIDDGLAREAALAPRSLDGSFLGGEVYVPFDAGFGGTHRIDVVAPFDGSRTTLAEISDVEGFGPPRFLHVRVTGETSEVLYVQTNDRFGSIARVDGETGEHIPLPNGPAWGAGPVRTAGSWAYFTNVRGGDDGPIEGVLLRVRLD